MLATLLLFIGAYLVSVRVEWFALGTRAPIQLDIIFAIGICCLVWGIKLL